MRPKNFFRQLRERGMSPLEREIDRTQRAIYRYEARTDVIAQEWADAQMPCCPHCWSQEYRDLCAKLERVRPWLEHMQTKLKRNRGGN